MNNNWHSLSEVDIIKNLNSSRNGLSLNEIEKRQKQYGKNVLPKEKKPTLLKVFINQFKSPMIIVLIIAGFISSAIGDYKDGIFIAIVIVLNAVLGTYQEYSAIKSAANIQSLLRINAKILRDSIKVEVDSEELVPGDIVLLESGDKVPADIRVLEAYNLKLDESFLTGESKGVNKNSNIVNQEVIIADRTNMCYASSIVQFGRCVGIVTSTGINTEIGNISENLKETKEVKSPLTIRMEKFTKQIMVLVSIFAVFTSILMIVKNYDKKEVFLLVVAMCVSAIPESLPIAQTVVLSIATSKMVKKHVIVKKLSSVESLGSCTVIASDKTGTLTVNQQTAKIISMPDGTRLKISGEGYNDIGNIELNNVGARLASPETEENTHTLVEHICKMGVLNNEAFLDKEDEKFVYHGDSIDLAFLSLGLKYGINEKKLKQELKIFGRIPYESEHKFSAVFYNVNDVVGVHDCTLDEPETNVGAWLAPPRHHPDNPKNYVTVKGSAETILEFCTNHDISSHEKEFLRLSEEGYRVIALASREIYW